MTFHYIRNQYSFESICEKSIYEIYQSRDGACTGTLESTTCQACISKMEDIVRKLKNGNS